MYKNTENNFNYSLLIELSKHLLTFENDLPWFQGIVNLLEKILNADEVILYSFSNNTSISSINQIKYNSCNSKLNIKETFLKDNAYIVPCHGFGVIEILFKKTPDNVLLIEVESILDLVKQALLNSTNITTSLLNEKYSNSLNKIKTIILNGLNFKDLISEIFSCLNCSRVQIKFFSKNSTSTYDIEKSFEVVKDGFLEGISVIPSFEDEFISLVKNKNFSSYEKNLTKDYSIDLEDKIEGLLSIKSVYGEPILYKNNAIGLIIIHECNVSRLWTIEEKKYLNEISFLLSCYLGKEYEIEKLNKSSMQSLKNILNSDEFLRLLGSLQVQSNISNEPFSLILVDIDKLSEINNKLGFVAGSLVLSHTSRVLSRFYDGNHQIAKYSNDEYVIVLNNVDSKKILIEVENLKDKLSNASVLGIGPVYYNFSHVTYPTHSTSSSKLLCLLEEGMTLSKSRGKTQICGASELLDKNKNIDFLISRNTPKIVQEKTSFKTGPEIIETISNQLLISNQHEAYNSHVLDSVQSLALALDAKDSYTEGHSQRVSEYAYMLAKKINLELNEQEWVRLAALLHDIGKIGIPESILCKNGKLTTEEFEIMKKHPVIGARILKPIKPLEKVAELVLSHHEYYNGSGYPHGLKKDEIPIGAMIVSITDAYQAMTSDRPYRAGMPQEKAFQLLLAGKEKQWHPELIDEFISLVAA